MLLEAKIMQNSGVLEDSLGLDKHLLQQSKNKKVVELEDLQQQMNMLMLVPGASQLLHIMIQNYTSKMNKIEESCTAMANAWVSGDEAATLKVTEESVKQVTEYLQDRYHNHMALDRNAAMVHKSSRLMVTIYRQFLWQSVQGT